MRTMARYDPLRDYLQKQTLRELVLTFREVEEIVGGTLPASAERPQWWANEADIDTSHVQRNAWRAAGYDAFLVSGLRKVRFQKVF